MRGEHGGGLVEDEDFRVAGEGLDDFYALLCADGQVFDEGVGVNVETEACGEFTNLVTGGVVVKDSSNAGGGFVAEGYGFSDGEDRYQHEVLVDHADTGGYCVAGAAEGLRLAVDENAAVIGLVEAIKNVHQR